MMAADAQLKEALAKGPFALIGAGQLGAMTLAMWPPTLPKPVFLLDTSRRGTLDGIEIHDLQSHRARPDVTYLLSAFKMPADEVRRIFEGLGQDLILTVYDLFEEHMPALFSNGWRSLSPSPDVLARLERLPQWFADDLSAQICRSVEAWRYRRELVSDYPVTPEAGKYDLALLGRGGAHYDTVYDCGSFDLGLLDSLQKAGVTFDKVVAFEPDPGNFSACAARVASLMTETASEIRLDRHAVRDAVGPQAFVANGQLSARIVDRVHQDHPDRIDVECCTLDSVFDTDGAADGPVLVKLHIEGSEPFAIAGASRMIGTAQTDLLINLSHDERSFLEIPQVLAQTGRFDLYLRSHSLFGEGLTLFARQRPHQPH